MSARALLLVVACAELLGLHLAAFFLLGTSAVLAAVLFIASWSIFIVLGVQANRRNPRARIPKARKGGTHSGEPAPEEGCGCGEV
jgi:hypothetical protein